MNSLIELSEQGLVPSPVIRLGIRALLRRRKESIEGFDLAAYCEQLRRSEFMIPKSTDAETERELPATFFQKVLGPHLKFSACYFPRSDSALEEAEAAMLHLSCERAELEDGQRILELGCGWGSLTLWMAERYPRAEITAVAESVLHKRFVDEQAAARGSRNVRVLVRKLNDFESEALFDRVVSVEMLECVRNYEELLRRVSCWLVPRGKLFVHMFSHHASAYRIEAKGRGAWMGMHFFRGGQMPSHGLLPWFQRDLKLEQSWAVNGLHYQRTAEAWASSLESHKHDILPILAAVYGESEKERWFWRWKIFFLTCSELFGFGKGDEWRVSHYRFVKPWAD